MSLALVEPWELGLPDKYDSFRPCQIEAVDWVMSREERFLCMGLPPGSGKTLVAAAIHKATGLRTVVLTATRGLQDQYSTTLPCFDIKGKANYECSELDNISCRFGKQEGCKFHKSVKRADGAEFEVADPQCNYEGRKRRAQLEPLVDTNYSYWFRANRFGRGLEPPPEEPPNPVELLILDEAHLAFEELSRSLGLTLQERRLVELGLRAGDYPQKADSIDVWSAWALGPGITMVKQLLEQAKLDLKKCQGAQLARNKAREKVFRLEELQEGVDKLAYMNDRDWVMDRQDGTENGRRWQFDCIWPGAWSESRLFFGIKKVVLMSGTLRPESLRMLGIKKVDSVFKEWPRQFPAQNTPIYHVRTVKLSFNASPEDLKIWVDRIDEILEMEFKAGNKGLIHTVSYARQKYLHDHSRFSHLFYMNTKDPESPSATEVVENFRKAAGPAVLVSPSFGTGWDFADEQARFIIVAKIPFPDFRSKVMQARLKRSPAYTDHLTMQDLVQGTQRGSRHEEDFCRCYIVDDNLTFFMKKSKGLAPAWFSVIRLNSVPQIHS